MWIHRTKSAMAKNFCILFLLVIFVEVLVPFALCETLESDDDSVWTPSSKSTCCGTQKCKTGIPCDKFRFPYTPYQSCPLDKNEIKRAAVQRPVPYFEGNAIVDKKPSFIRQLDYIGKYLVLIFYPMDFTFVCPTEITSFSDRIEDFRGKNTEVVACSTDSLYTHLAWINTSRSEGGLGGDVKIPLLADLNGHISKSYGVYLESLGHSLRGTFIIDREGILRQITINDLPVGRSVDETLRLVQALQYTDEHKEVCPAGWNPGSDTIEPDSVDKLKYFQKTYKPQCKNKNND